MQSPYLGGYIERMQQNDELLSFVDKKTILWLFLKRISEKLVDKDSKVVRDRQGDNV